MDENLDKEYEKCYRISSDDKNDIVYEDPSCFIGLTVADFRDKVWWVSINKVIIKNDQQSKKITKAQKHEIYRRVSSDVRLHGVEGVYTVDFKFVNVDLADIDYTKTILEISE